MTDRIFAVAALAFGLTACAVPPSPQSTLEAFVARQSTAAVSAEHDGRLREAMNLWQTVITAEPSNAGARAAIGALASLIENETRSAIREGQAAYGRGQTRDGDRWMLRALALSPGEPTALKALRSSVSEASHSRQEEKVESAYEGVEEGRKEEDTPSESRDPVSELQDMFDAGDYEGLLSTVAEDSTQGSSLDAPTAVLVRDSYLALARRARDAGQSEQQLMYLDKALATLPANPDDDLQRERQELAGGLSNNYYRQSLTLMQGDLDAAITALERAIQLNPNNLPAVEKLDQAKTLKRNLRKIQAR